jgi:hypothetical protein
LAAKGGVVAVIRRLAPQPVHQSRIAAGFKLAVAARLKPYNYSWPVLS